MDKEDKILSIRMRNQRIKYFVIGLVHNEGGHITDGLYPNHYVQLLDFNRQNFASFWTWGENRPRISHVFGLMHGIHQIYMIKR